MDEIIRTHSAYVARLAYRLLGRDDEVDDVVQDVFIVFLRFHRAIRSPEALRAWLSTTTVRLVHRRLRARSRRAAAPLEAGGDALDLRASGTSPEDHAALWSIHRALDGVPPPARTAWILRYLAEEQLEDVARLCRCSLATVKRRIALAHTAVKSALEGP